MRKRNVHSANSAPKISIDLAPTQAAPSIKAFAALSQQSGGLNAFQKLLKNSVLNETPQIELPKKHYEEAVTPKQELKRSVKSKQDYSYSESYYSDYSYSSSSDEEQEDNGIQNLIYMFQGIEMKISKEEKSSSDKEKEDELYALRSKLAELKTMLLESNKTTTEIVFENELFFTELFDFFQHIHDDLSCVKPEFLDPIGVMERIRQLRKIDEDHYKTSELGENAKEILTFYADIEFNEWSFLDRQPLIDMPWIRAGWMWLDEDGNGDMVPQIFDDFADQLIEKLKHVKLSCESDFLVAHAHCLEIVDYCQHATIMELQLNNVLKEKIKKAVPKILNKKQYEYIMSECGFKELNKNKWSEPF